jgi:hypothetical protein
MKSSNLALRLDDDEALLERTPRKDDVPTAQEVPKPVVRRPRRSLGFRSIVVRDQGFAPFRVR